MGGRTVIEGWVINVGTWAVCCKLRVVCSSGSKYIYPVFTGHIMSLLVLSLYPPDSVMNGWMREGSV